MTAGANGSRAGYETARLALARLRLTGADARGAALRQVAEIGARALGVARASMWTLRAGQTGSEAQLQCDCQLELVSGTVTHEVAQRELEAPRFLAALADRRVLAVSDAAADPRTSELHAAHLARYGVGSIIAAPIIRDGQVSGVVFVEHVGPTRLWSQLDRDFAACVADGAALFLEQADRLEIEAALRERRETELIKQKMVALERLARSVAHDVNNVLGTLDLVGSTLELDGRADVVKRGNDVRRIVAVGARIVEQMSLFAGQTTKRGERSDLGALLRQIEPALAQMVEGARLELAVSAEATVPLGRGEMQQLVMNLCVNAREAVTPGGLIRVELREPRPDEPVSPMSVMLTVTDDGAGIDAETKAHMFEPYFSRKEPGRGIGLSIVYGIVEKVDGTILVDSAPGEGATFRIALPRAFGPPAASND